MIFGIALYQYLYGFAGLSLLLGLLFSLFHFNAGVVRALTTFLVPAFFVAVSIAAGARLLHLLTQIRDGLRE